MVDNTLKAIKLAVDYINTPEYKKKQEEEKFQKELEKLRREKSFHAWKDQNKVTRNNELQKLGEAYCKLNDIMRKRKKLFIGLLAKKKLTNIQAKQLTKSKNIVSLVRDTNKALRNVECKLKFRICSTHHSFEGNHYYLVEISK